MSSVLLFCCIVFVGWFACMRRAWQRAEGREQRGPAQTGDRQSPIASRQPTVNLSVNHHPQSARHSPNVRTPHHNPSQHLHLCLYNLQASRALEHAAPSWHASRGQRTHTGTPARTKIRRICSALLAHWLRMNAAIRTLSSATLSL